MYTRSSINWSEAKWFYITDTRYSYSKLATMYGVTKSTIQKRATREGWAAERRRYRDKAISKFMSNYAYDIDEINDRHIKLYKNMQVAGYQLFTRAVSEMEAGKLKKASMTLKRSAGVMNKGIKGERKILGLPTKLKKMDIETKATRSSLESWQDLIDKISEESKNQE